MALRNAKCVYTLHHVQGTLPSCLVHNLHNLVQPSCSVSGVPPDRRNIVVSPANGYVYDCVSVSTVSPGN